MIEYSFMDNAIYAVDDLNKITTRLVTSGITDPLTDGVPYNCRKINDIVSVVATSGVVPDGVTTLKVVTSDTVGKFWVMPGTAFFANGSNITLTASEYVAYTEGVGNYIYLKSDLTLNKNYIVCDTTGPAYGDDTVLLAYADGLGIQDKRVYAKGKVPGYQSNANAKMEFTHTFTGVTVGEYRDFTGKTFQIDIGVNNYEKLIVDNGYFGTNTAIGCSLTNYNLLDGTFKCYVIGLSVTGISTNKIYMTHGDVNTVLLTISKSGSVLTFTLSGGTRAANTITINGFLC